MRRNIIIALLSGLLGFYSGYLYGVNKTFVKFAEEECWINKQTRDVECIAYIK